LKLLPVGALPKGDPPTATVYQAIEDPALDDAFKFVVPPGAHSWFGETVTKEGVVH
jgi:hypothetical protein